MWAPTISFEGNRKQAWNLRGCVLVTISSGYLAYAVRLLTQLSLLHNKNQCSRYGRRSAALAYIAARLWAGRILKQVLSTKFLSAGFKWITGPICTTPWAISHSFPTLGLTGAGEFVSVDMHDLRGPAQLLSRRPPGSQRTAGFSVPIFAGSTTMWNRVAPAVAH